MKSLEMKYALYHWIMLLEYHFIWKTHFVSITFWSFSYGTSSYVLLSINVWYSSSIAFFHLSVSFDERHLVCWLGHYWLSICLYCWDQCLTFFPLLNIFLIHLILVYLWYFIRFPDTLSIGISSPFYQILFLIEIICLAFYNPIDFVFNVIF